MDSWFLAAVRGSKGNEKLVAEDPLRRVCLGGLRNIPAQGICIVLVAVQAFLINHHLVTSSETNEKNLWIWFAGDAVVVIGFIVTFFLREWRLQSVTVKHKESTEFRKGLPFGSLSWLLYAVLLGTRIAIIFKEDLQHEAEIGNLKATISATAVICVMFTIGHHHNHESLARRAAILSLAKMFTIDLLDTVDVLDVLFETAKEQKDFPIILEDFVLAIVGINLIRPSVVLLSLFMDHFATPKRALQVKIAKTFIELLLLNIPLLVIRIYISVRYEGFLSVFLVKNILGSMMGIIEIYDCSYDIHEYDYLKQNQTKSTPNEGSENNNGKVEGKIEISVL